MQRERTNCDVLPLNMLLRVFFFSTLVSYGLTVLPPQKIIGVVTGGLSMAVSRFQVGIAKSKPAIRSGPPIEKPD